MSETNRNKTGQRSNTGTRSSASRSTGKKTGSSSSRSSKSSSRRNSERVAAVQNARNLGSGTGSTKRTTSTNRRRKRRRQGPDFAKLLLVLIGLVIVILCVAVGVKGCSRNGDKKISIAEETTTEPETELHVEITVNGISINGLTKSEAKEKILGAMDWDMKVTYDGDTKSLDNLMASNVDKVLDEAIEKGEAGTYTVSTDGLEEAVNAAVEKLAAGWDVKAKNGSISSYDSASGEFIFSGAQNGKEIDRVKLVAEILSAIDAGEYQKTITATANVVEPEITEAQAKASFKRLGTYTTTTTSNKARNENIRIASQAINGKIIQPGEEFSFNLTTGNRTEEKGYQAAGAYVNGVLVEEPGGGVCQVSSTLYNAVVFSGLKTTERHAHSYEPSYVTPGEDAMVSYDGYSGPDMKFVNNSKTAVGIKTSFSNQKLTVSIYGNPILEDGVTLSMVSTKTKELDPPAPVYEEDPTLEPGVEVEVKAATPGSRWVTNLVTKKDGVVVNEILLHNSTYSGKSATIKRNTSGTVASTEGGSTTAESASSVGTESTENTKPSSGQTTSPSSESTTPAVSPGGSTSQESGVQVSGPADTIKPSSDTTEETTSSSGPIPQSPADMTSPANPSSTTAASPSTGGPGSVETSASPSGVGLIAPIG